MGMEMKIVRYIEQEIGNRKEKKGERREANSHSYIPFSTPPFPYKHNSPSLVPFERWM